MLKNVTDLAHAKVSENLKEYLEFTKTKSIFVPEIKSYDEQNPVEFLNRKLSPLNRKLSAEPRLMQKNLTDLKNNLEVSKKDARKLIQIFA